MHRVGRIASLALVALACAASPALGQRAQRSGAPAEAVLTDEVLAVREAIRAAIAGRDRQALERLYAENFSHIRPSGRTDLKGERIALLLSGEPAIETAPEEGVVVEVYGPSTAVVTGVSPIRDRATGRTTAFRWLAVYVKREEGWQVALSQASRVQAGRR